MVEGSDGEHAQQVRRGANRQRDGADADPDHGDAGDVEQ